MTHESHPRWNQPSAVALTGALAISWSGIWVALSGLPPDVSAFLRTAYALPLLYFLRLRSLRGTFSGRGSHQRRLAIVAGALLGLDLMMWHRSVMNIGAGLATVLGNLQVVIVALVAYVWLRERHAGATWFAVFAALGGVVFASGAGRLDAYGSNPTLGTLQGVATAFLYAAFLITLRHSQGTKSRPAPVLWDVTLGAAMVTGLGVIVTGTGASLVPAWPSHAHILVLAWGSHVLGWLALTSALPRLTALTGSTLLLVQPGLSVVWGMLFLAERPSWTQVAGVVLILVAIAFASVQRGGRRARPPDAQQAS